MAGCVALLETLMTLPHLHPTPPHHFPPTIKQPLLPGAPEDVADKEFDVWLCCFGVGERWLKVHGIGRVVGLRFPCGRHSLSHPLLRWLARADAGSGDSRGMVLRIPVSVLFFVGVYLFFQRTMFRYWVWVGEQSHLGLVRSLSFRASKRFQIKTDSVELSVAQWFNNQMISTFTFLGMPRSVFTCACVCAHCGSHTYKFSFFAFFCEQIPHFNSEPTSKWTLVCH